MYVCVVGEALGLEWALSPFSAGGLRLKSDLSPL